MAVEQLRPDAGQKGKQNSEVKFPAYNLVDSAEVAKAIHSKGGGRATADHLSAYLGYKSTSNGAYLSRVGAARHFGLIQKSGENFSLTPLATQILMPVYPEQAKQGLVTAFLNVDLYKRVFDDYKGKELPNEFGMKNALKNIYGVVPGRVDVAYRGLMDSAEAAGFFATRNGTRSHLIMPVFQHGAAEPAQPAAEPPADSSGGGGVPPRTNVEVTPPTAELRMISGGAPSIDTMKAKYLDTLIRMLDDKTQKGEVDVELMTRIERLLGVQA